MQQEFTYDPKKHMKITDWIKREFHGKPPQARTVADWVKQGVLQGTQLKIGKKTQTFIRADQRLSELSAVDKAVRELIELSR